MTVSGDQALSLGVLVHLLAHLEGPEDPCFTGSRSKAQTSQDWGGGGARKVKTKSPDKFGH